MVWETRLQSWLKGRNDQLIYISDMFPCRKNQIVRYDNQERLWDSFWVYQNTLREYSFNILRNILIPNSQLFNLVKEKDPNNQVIGIHSIGFEVTYEWLNIKKT